jgi:hypothetical protein
MSALEGIRDMLTIHAGEPSLLGDVFKIADAACAEQSRRRSTRETVFEALSGERTYQDAMSADPARPDMVPEMSMGEIILAMEHTLGEARRIWYGDSKPYHATIEHLRKVGGLSVKAMEQFGVVYRQGYYS